LPFLDRLLLEIEDACLRKNRGRDCTDHAHVGRQRRKCMVIGEAVLFSRCRLEEN
jgi:hypothetical protein